MECPRCGAAIPEAAETCPLCGNPIVDEPREGAIEARGGPAVEPEVLASLDEAHRSRFTGGPAIRQFGYSLGPGFGCIVLPFAVLGGLALSLLVALLWVLSLGRVPASLLRLAKQVRRGQWRS